MEHGEGEPGARLTVAPPALDDLGHALGRRQPGRVEPVPDLLVVAGDVSVDVALVEGPQGHDTVGERLVPVGHPPTLTSPSATVVAEGLDPDQPARTEAASRSSPTGVA